MEIVSLAEIYINPEAFAKKLRIRDQGLVKQLIDTAQRVSTPAAAYRVSYIEEKRDDGVFVENVFLKSRVLRRNLDAIGRLFPFVLTLGRAMDETLDASTDMLEKYLLDEIANKILRKARSRFEEHLRSVFALRTISCMTPGSLPDWPIEEQQPLFRLLPGAESTLGVRLTESFLLLPRKSVSGVYFPSETNFLSCQICPRERCDSRRASYDPRKAKDYGVLR